MNYMFDITVTNNNINTMVEIKETRCSLIFLAVTTMFLLTIKLMIIIGLSQHQTENVSIEIISQFQSTHRNIITQFLNTNDTLIEKLIKSRKNIQLFLKCLSYNEICKFQCKIETKGAVISSNCQLWQPYITSSDGRITVCYEPYALVFCDGLIKESVQIYHAHLVYQNGTSGFEISFAN